MTFCPIILLFSYLFFFPKSVDKFTFFFQGTLCLVLRIIAALCDFINHLLSKESHCGAGELTQQLAALDALLEDLGLLPSTYIETLIITCSSSSREPDTPLLASAGTH